MKKYLSHLMLCLQLTIFATTPACIAENTGHEQDEKVGGVVVLALIFEGALFWYSCPETGYCEQLSNERNATKTYDCNSSLPDPFTLADLQNNCSEQ